MGPSRWKLAAMLVMWVGALGLGAAYRWIWPPPEGPATIVQTSSPSQPHWQVVDASCTTHCSRELERRIRSRLGAELVITEDRFAAPFVPHCEGDDSSRLSWEPLPWLSAFDLLNELDPDRNESPTLTARYLGHSVNELYSGFVSCRLGDLRFPIARILSLEPDRMLLLYGGSVLELKKSSLYRPARHMR